MAVKKGTGSKSVGSKVAVKAAPAKKAAAKAAAKPKTLVKPKNGTQYTQAEFYECLREMCEFEKRTTAKNVMGGFVGLVQAALKKGYKVPLPGMGKIQVRSSKARTGRNPATGETIQIPARKRVRLTVSKGFKESVLK